MNFRKARRTVLSMVEDVGKQFTKPDDDWVPVLILHTPNGVKVFGTGFRSNADKDAWAALMPELFREHRPTFAAMVTSAWQRMLDKDDPLAELTLDMADRFGVSSDPKREEIVLVQCSDGKQSETWTAPILRHPTRSPTLGEWKVMTAEMSGRFADVLTNGFEAMGSGR